MKIGILTLLYKKGDLELMKNYRPVSLQNNDVKLLTKIICTRLKPQTTVSELKPIMSSLITQHQYANTSKNISTAISLLRDLQSCVKNDQLNITSFRSTLSKRMIPSIGNIFLKS